MEGYRKMEAQVQWVAPPSMWGETASLPSARQRRTFRQPAIYRFASDAFMDEFKGVLNSQPGRLSEWAAAPETWQSPLARPTPAEALPPFARRLQRLRLASVTLTAATKAPPPAAPPAAQDAADEGPLKLYQPAHLRYYLISACLVCRIPGLPDRMLNIGAGEKTTFVVRRLRSKTPGELPRGFEFNLDTCDEYAFVGGQWVKAGAGVMPSEEQLPMFPYTYIERDNRKRRLLSALIPVSNREKYIGARAAPLDPEAEQPNAVAATDPRKAVLMSQVTDPWRSLIKRWNKSEAVFTATGDAAPPAGAELNRFVTEAKDEADYLSWLLLLDLSDFLERYLPAVWDAVVDESAANLTTDAQADVYDVLQTTTFNDGNGTRSLADALVAIRDSRDDLEGTTIQYTTYNTAPLRPPFPAFRFPLQAPHIAALVDGFAQTLDDLITAALPEQLPPKTPPLPLGASLTQNMREPYWFVIRCIFERPNCVPLVPSVMSEATEPFQMAGFFDPDAPARPIRIPMPVDTSTAGLRKFDKNTVLELSDALCAQLTRARSLSFGDLVLSVLPWPFHKNLPDVDTSQCENSVGQICSLSIPIITICAMILLVIMVSLLDLIFHWIPFFISCFPLPNFSSKGAAR